MLNQAGIGSVSDGLVMILILSEIILRQTLQASMRRQLPIRHTNKSNNAVMILIITVAYKLISSTSQVRHLSLRLIAYHQVSLPLKIPWCQRYRR